MYTYPNFWGLYPIDDYSHLNTPVPCRPAGGSATRQRKGKAGAQSRWYENLGILRQFFSFLTIETQGRCYCSCYPIPIAYSGVETTSGDFI